MNDGVAAVIQRSVIMTQLVVIAWLLVDIKILLAQ